MNEKYVLELEPLLQDSNGKTKMWKAVNFNTLVFDENGVKKLKKLEDCMEDVAVFKNDEIKVGDILRNQHNSGVRLVVTYADEENEVYAGVALGGDTNCNSAGQTFSYVTRDSWEKTGDSVPMADILRQARERAVPDITIGQAIVVAAGILAFSYLFAHI